MQRCRIWTCKRMILAESVQHGDAGSPHKCPESYTLTQFSPAYSTRKGEACRLLLHGRHFVAAVEAAAKADIVIKQNMAMHLRRLGIRLCYN